MPVVVLQGMCYAGKTTLGAMVGEKLGLPFLDSRDLFRQTHGVSELEYLAEHGSKGFGMAERACLEQDFEDVVLALAGSSVYYDEQMERLHERYPVVHLNVPLPVIQRRRAADPAERPIVYPEGVDTFDALYRQRAALYPRWADVRIDVTADDTPDEVSRRITTSLASLGESRAQS
jgi:shikimate kinase